MSLLRLQTLDLRSAALSRDGFGTGPQATPPSPLSPTGQSIKSHMTLNWSAADEVGHHCLKKSKLLRNPRRIKNKCDEKSDKRQTNCASCATASSVSERPPVSPGQSYGCSERLQQRRITPYSVGRLTSDLWWRRGQRSHTAGDK